MTTMTLFILKHFTCYMRESDPFKLNKVDFAAVQIELLYDSS